MAQHRARSIHTRANSLLVVELRGDCGWTAWSAHRQDEEPCTLLRRLARCVDCCAHVQAPGLVRRCCYESRRESKVTRRGYANSGRTRQWHHHRACGRVMCAGRLDTNSRGSELTAGAELGLNSFGTPRPPRRRRLRRHRHRRHCRPPWAQAGRPAPLRLQRDVVRVAVRSQTPPRAVHSECSSPRPAGTLFAAGQAAR